MAFSCYNILLHLIKYLITNIYSILFNHNAEGRRVDVNSFQNVYNEEIPSMRTFQFPTFRSSTAEDFFNGWLHREAIQIYQHLIFQKT